MQVEEQFFILTFLRTAKKCNGKETVKSEHEIAPNVEALSKTGRKAGGKVETWNSSYGKSLKKAISLQQ